MLVEQPIHDDDRVIIVASPEVSRQLLARVRDDAAVITFRTLEDLDRWRARGPQAVDTISADVAAALEEIACRLTALPRKLQHVLEAAGQRHMTPALRDLQKHWPSRRSFYRTWSESIDDPPSNFLRRVRIHHVKRLLARGFAPKEAAHAAGFSSVDRMRKQLAKFDRKHPLPRPLHRRAGSPPATRS